MHRRTLPVVLALLATGGCGAVDEPLGNATRFVAHMSCSCVFNSGRSLDSCLQDLPREAGWLSLDVDREAHTVTASALWVDGVAEYTEGRGCKLRD